MEAFEGPFLRVEGIEKPLLNMANFDFLGMGQRKELKQAAVQALDKVGPRNDTTGRLDWAAGVGLGWQPDGREGEVWGARRGGEGETS